MLVRTKFTNSCLSVPLKHVHITFHHIYKNQAGWEQILSRYARGGGTLLDLEFLEKEVAPGRFVRVSAFGWSAGFSGAALALRNWAWQLTNPGKPLPGVESYNNEEDLIADVKKSLEEGKAKEEQIERDVATVAELLNGIEGARMKTLAQEQGGEWEPLRREDMQALQALSGK